MRYTGACAGVCAGVAAGACAGVLAGAGVSQVAHPVHNKTNVSTLILQHICHTHACHSHTHHTLVDECMLTVFPSHLLPEVLPASDGQERGANNMKSKYS